MSGYDDDEPYVFTSVGTEDLPLAETWVLPLPHVPLVVDYDIFFEVTTELGGVVDVRLLDDVNGTLGVAPDVEAMELHWAVIPLDHASFITVTPKVAPDGKERVNLEWKLSIVEGSAGESHGPGTAQEEESREYWTNSTVLILGLVGIAVAVVLLILALQPFRLEPSARKDLASVRFHQQKMR